MRNFTEYMVATAIENTTKVYEVKNNAVNNDDVWIWS
ncbi:F0F1 ATP synthase subunit alpha [Streptococcus pneumoniae]|nr:F0F1 ATP synthase subunit alpha [Streptococcus pneumoniae]